MQTGFRCVHQSKTGRSITIANNAQYQEHTQSIVKVIKPTGATMLRKPSHGRHKSRLELETVNSN